MWFGDGASLRLVARSSAPLATLPSTLNSWQSESCSVTTETPELMMATSLHPVRRLSSRRQQASPPIQLEIHARFTTFQFSELITRISEPELLSGAVRGLRKKPPTTSPSGLLPLVHAGSH
jgi:hypothetical protein